MENNNQQLINGLRAMAKWLDEHPSMPHIPADDLFLLPVLTEERMVEVVRTFGTCEKRYDDYLNAIKRFGPVGINAYISRMQVCTRKVVGIKEVPEMVIPAKVIPAHLEEIVEWECDPLLGGEQGS